MATEVAVSQEQQEPAIYRSGGGGGYRIRRDV